MEKQGKNYKIVSCADISSGGRIELHDKLALTGAEITINTLPAGVSVPFVHAHKLNEEIYAILDGKGMLYIDGEELEIKAGDVLRIDPAGERCIKADTLSPIKFICIQAEAKSLTQFNRNDGLPLKIKPSWFA